VQVHSLSGFVGALLAALLFIAPSSAAQAGMETERFTFVSDGKRLSGFLDTPAEGEAQALIIIVHGYGQSDVAGRTSYMDLRSRFTAMGIATLIWDKPGCGESEGVFDANQPVASSAQEVLDAIPALRAQGAPGARKIGLWGISRAGWIAPLAIAQSDDIDFWISVSGTDDKENFGYLLESNLRIEGRSEAEIAHLLGEWRRGNSIVAAGGSYSEYLAATETLRHDPFWIYLEGPPALDEAAYLAEQQAVLSEPPLIDEATGLQIYVPDFEAVLARADMPVLALFGEKDTSVDWRATSALYRRTIGQNLNARLTIRTFGGANHNLQQAQTGGLREMIEMQDRRMAEGYYAAMEDWLRTEVLRD
jgi:pimeloyl-ACP methyl ester carboxylesterase